MANTIICPGCATSFVVSEKILGKQVRCRQCQTTFVAAIEQVPAPVDLFDSVLQEESRSKALAPTLQPNYVEPEVEPAQWYVLLMEYGHHLVFVALFLGSLALLVFGLTTEDVVFRRMFTMLGGFLTMFLAWAKIEIEFEKMRDLRPFALIAIPAILVLYYNFRLAN
jgi:predicted Zn finger-like uncharacterized protein